MAVQVSMPLLDEHEQECLIQDLVDLKPWMTKCRFDLIETEAELEAFIDKAIETGYCAIDTETTGLNLRPDNVNGGLITKIVGWCLAYDDNYGVYVPVRHYDYDRNLPVKVVNKHIKRLLAGVDKVIYHNYKYDGEVMRGEGIIQEDPDKWDDSLILHFVVHPEEERARGLKALSEKYLNRPMIELKELAPTKTKVHDFAIVPPQVATYYGASDAMNTLALWKLFTKNLHDMDPNGSDKKPGLKFIYNTEKRNMIVTMEMERNHVKIDVAYYRNHSDSLYARLEELEHRVYDMVGVKFDIQSSPQLAKILFEDLGIKYPEPRPEGSAGYSTKEEILAKVKGKGEDIINAILEYRGFKKIVSTYLENFLNNYDENDEIKICFHPTKASTGRFSSGGGSLHHDGYSGINGQNIPANYDPKAVDLRKGVIARPGFVFCAIDYSGEELRIATNMSKEPMWLDEFLRGSGDLHMVTATVIFKKPASAISKLERGVAKTLNFLSLYGGGAQGFAQQAKIPLEEAKVALDNFNTGLVGLAEWKDKERRTSKRRGFAQTAFGRRRPLKELYESGDRQLIAAADRHAINSAIQGCQNFNTRVLTDLYGYIKIGELYKTHTLESDCKVWTGSKWASFVVHDRGEWDLSDFYLKNGMTGGYDTRHEVLVASDSGYDFVHYDNLDSNSLVCVSVPTAKEFGSYPEKVSFSGGGANNSKNIEVTSWDDIAWLVGLYLGDGNLYKSKGTLCYSFGMEKVQKHLPRINSIVEGMGLSTVREVRSEGSVGESYRCNLYSTAIVELFEYLGVVPDQTSHTKTLPSFFWSAPLSMRKEFIRGYWDADGCKKTANRYGFHTANIDLLREVQQLSWTIGLSSIVRPMKIAGHGKLEWESLSDFEEVFGLPKGDYKTRSMSFMILPKFKQKEIYDLLTAANPKMPNVDRALMYKLRHGKNVTVQTAIRMLDQYGIERPELYYHYPLDKKVELGRKETTYTLSVFDDSHRFDTQGIISKNTGADIMKISMWRVWKHVRQNGWEDYVRFCLSIHDEIVFELREDLLDLLIPAISDIMKMGNITKALGWQVGLEVDAEYGSTFHVDFNYFEQVKDGIRKVATTVEEALANYEEYKIYLAKNGLVEKKEVAMEIPEEILSEESPVVGEIGELGVEGMDMGTDYSEEEEAPKVVKPPHVPLEHNPLRDDYLNYPVTKTDTLARRQADAIWAALETMEDTAQGPKKSIRLLSNDGKRRILFTTTKRYSVDGFLALATFMAI